MQSRPSVPDLDKKLKSAIEFVDNGKVLQINHGAIAGDAIELGYMIGDLHNVLLAILAEVKPEYYIGKRPPEKAYASQIKGSELFSFKWQCKRFGCEVYFKFCLKEDMFYLVSLHQNR